MSKQLKARHKAAEVAEHKERKQAEKEAKEQKQKDEKSHQMHREKSKDDEDIPKSGATNVMFYPIYQQVMSQLSSEFVTRMKKKSMHHCMYNLLPKLFSM